MCCTSWAMPPCAACATSWRTTGGCSSSIGTPTSSAPSDRRAITSTRLKKPARAYGAAATRSDRSGCSPTTSPSRRSVNNRLLFVLLHESHEQRVAIRGQHADDPPPILAQLAQGERTTVSRIEHVVAPVAGREMGDDVVILLLHSEAPASRRCRQALREAAPKRAAARDRALFTGLRAELGDSASSRRQEASAR